MIKSESLQGSIMIYLIMFQVLDDIIVYFDISILGKDTQILIF